MSRILLRFNTKFEQDSKGRTWRVLQDGVETLASEVVIQCHGETIQEDVDGVPKYHIVFNGDVVWVGDAAIITDEIGWDEEIEDEEIEDEEIEDEEIEDEEIEDEEIEWDDEHK